MAIALLQLRDIINAEGARAAGARLGVVHADEVATVLVLVRYTLVAQTAGLNSPDQEFVVDCSSQCKIERTRE